MRITPDMILIGSSVAVSALLMAKVLWTAKKAWPSRPVVVELLPVEDTSDKPLLPSAADIGLACDLIAARMEEDLDFGR